MRHYATAKLLMAVFMATDKVYPFLYPVTLVKFDAAKLLLLLNKNY